MVNKPTLPMRGRLPGVQQPNPIRPKSVMKVGARGKITTGAVIKHPSEVERIASVHRNAQWELNRIARSVDPNIHKKR
jgi:hypothetical protein